MDLSAGTLIYFWLVSISDEDSLSEIAISGASKLASTYFTLFYRSVHVLYTEILINQIRILQITNINILNVKVCPSNPAFDCTVNPKYQDIFARKESAIPTFGIRFQSMLENSNIPKNSVHETIISEVPPWTLHLFKSETPSHIFIQKFNDIKDEHSYCFLYDYWTLNLYIV